MADYNAIENQFIKEQLEKHAKFLNELYTKDIVFKNLIKDRDLIDASANTSNYKIYESGGNHHHLELKFPDHGRLIEIAFHKKIKTQKDIVNPFVLKKKVKKKNTNWYSRNTYGALNRLIGRLMWGLSDIEIERIKKLLATPII
jgi:hypothetical protein